MDNDKNVVSEKKEKIEPHVTNDYQEVEYLESTGTQYIDTEAKIFKNNNHEIVISFEPTSFYNYVTLWGTNYDADTFEAWIYSTGNIAGRYNLIRYGNDTLLNLNEKYTAKFIKKNSNLSFYLNDELKQSNVPTVNNKSVDSSLYLFKSGQDYGKYKLINVKLYSDDNLIRNLVPVIRKSDNKPGLLDLANKTNNLFDKSTALVGYRIAVSGINEQSSTACSDFIKVEGGINLSASNKSPATNYYFYDDEKVFISYASGFQATVPENAKYVRVNLDIDSLDSYMLNVGSTTLPYEPYGYKFYTNAGEGEFIPGPEA
jgi:hypothetical protein